MTLNSHYALRVKKHAPLGAHHENLITAALRGLFASAWLSCLLTALF